MDDVVLRPATKDDFPAIRALIRAVGINPIGLDWRRFLVAVTRAGELSGCVQVKPHADGSRELASLAVRGQDRGQGVARALIERLLEGQPRPVHLMCRAGLGLFYNQHGFRVVEENEMTPYFRRVSRLFRRFAGGGLLVMRLD
ncbi:MAG: GCN5-like N-acetyltransferase [Anaerolineaceae bacterium]|nr:MAG: GCN5-like N-acetyltransferase [Anaerolineaceae bacterium]